MKIEKLLKKTERSIPPPSLKLKVMEKIKIEPQEVNRAREESTFKPSMIAGLLATAALLVIVINATLPTPVMGAQEREELVYYIEEVTAPSIVGFIETEEEYESTSDDIVTFVSDTVEDVFWINKEDNNA
jgi:hypothetical protein